MICQVCLCCVFEFFCPKELYLPLCKMRYEHLLRNSQNDRCSVRFSKHILLSCLCPCAVENCKKKKKKKKTTVDQAVESLVGMKVKGFCKNFLQKGIVKSFSGWCNIVMLKSSHLTGFYLLEVCPLLRFCVTLIKCLVKECWCMFLTFLCRLSKCLDFYTIGQTTV